MKMGLLLFIIVCLTGGSVMDVVAAEYLTVEERNRIAMEEALNQFKQFQDMQQEDYKPPEIDYSQYRIVQDYKSVFGGLNNVALAQHRQELDGTTRLQEIERHRELVENAAVDYIVLPVQEMGIPEQDVISKLLSAESIAGELSARTSMKVLPVETVMRAYGWGKMLLDEQVIFQLLGERNTRVIHLYLKRVLSLPLGAPDKGQYDLAVVVSDSRGQIMNQAIYRFDVISPMETLEKKVDALSNEIVGCITGLKEKRTTSQSGSLSTIDDRALDGDFVSLVRDVGASTHAAYFQLLAMLTPASLHSERVYLFNRSLLALEKESGNGPELQLLRARALHYLHRRPQAIALLSKADTPEAVALRAYLNGNYPILKESIAGIKNPLLYTLSFLELHNLSSDYGKKLPELDNSKVKGGWAWLINRQCQSQADWYIESMGDLWSAMVALLPEMADLKERLVDSFPPVDVSDEDSELVVIERLLYLLGQDIPSAEMYSTQVTGEDIQRWYRNLIVNNLESRLYRISYLQGRYEDGIAFAEKRASVLDGQPRFSMLYARALVNLAKRNVHQRQYLLKQANDIACTVFGSTYPYENISRYMQMLVGDIAKLGYRDGHCTHSWNFKQFPSSEENHIYSATSFHYLEQDFRQKRIGGEEFARNLETRFAGHPEKTRFLAEDLWKRGHRDEAIATLRRAITEDDLGWRLYDLLGEYLIKEADFHGAEEVMASYPFFISTPDHFRVNTANLAYDVGSRFLRVGRYEQAKRFFELSVSFRTGSGSEMRSLFYLHCLAGDYQSAAESAYHEYKSYNSVEGFVRYYRILVMLGKQGRERGALQRHLMRNSGNEAWELWQALIIGQRSQQLPDESLHDIAGKVTQEVHAKEISLKADFNIFMDATFDRDLEDGKKVAYIQQGRVLKKIWPENGVAVLFPDLAEQLREKWESVPEGREPFMKYDCLYSALAAIQANRFDEALEYFVFHDMSGVWPNTLQNDVVSTYMFPFVVEAVGRSHYGGAEKLNELLELRQKERKNSQKGSSDYLAEAFAFALTEDEDIDSSLSALKQAYLCSYNHYYSIKGAERLYGITGDTRFIEIALDWSRRIQVTSPWLSWPYAFEAAFGTERARRVKAASRARYLDPNSRWLHRVPIGIREASGDEPFQESSGGTGTADTEQLGEEV